MDKHTKKQRNKETKKQRNNKETSTVNKPITKQTKYSLALDVVQPVGTKARDIPTYRTYEKHIHVHIHQP